MNQTERRMLLIEQLLGESEKFSGILVPQGEHEQKRLLRSLMNIRLPKPIDASFLQIQDEYLKAEIAEKGVTDYQSLSPVSDEIYLWQGDITTLKCGAIVNAANSGMTGCYYPCHACIDNCIHSFSGVQLRLACHEIMARQGYEEPTGRAKITSAFNLPCDYVIHTVGPIVGNNVTEKDKELLSSCYRSSLALAEEHGLDSIAFCCISTGEFHFPNRLAAEIAIKTVKNYKAQTNSEIKVIFNVFKNEDYKIYRKLFGANK